ncbi:Uma2 family endonuclease [Saccharopolyspora sp. K220]|uniref:Uma2 family endonuclease n=1 Tax=Saccharopolyspora soli TaxID=2926618 RepID=UPI001F59C66B|nr:Uma2 family endonuclease [Saccharopolyspora soli]MCI2422022.1 Uma2 family endonuclease [Saccharopolyspora soli]
MSVMTWPDHPLTLEEFDQLPEDNSRRYELQEGNLQVTAQAAGIHQRIVRQLTRVLDDQMLEEWEAAQDMEVILTPTWPPTVRVPDVVIAPTALIDQDPTRIHAKDVAVAVEVVSPGSGRTDRLLKMFEYAKAGIPFYWIIERTDHSIALTEHHFVEGIYEVITECRGGVFTADLPFELHVDLDVLTRRPRRR